MTPARWYIEPHDGECPRCYKSTYRCQECDHDPFVAALSIKHPALPNAIILPEETPTSLAYRICDLLNANGVQP